MTFDWKALPDVAGLTVGILGGTGEHGRGLAYRLARAGQRVIIGSRSSERAMLAAQELAAMPLVAGPVSGVSNTEAAGASDIVIIAVPWDGHAETVATVREPLVGKIVVDSVNPLGFDREGPYAVRVPEGSAAEQAESLLPFSRVCASFHHVSAVLLMDPLVERVDVDVMVLGNDREAVSVVMALAGRINGMRGVYAGRLRNAKMILRTRFAFGLRDIA